MICSSAKDKIISYRNRYNQTPPALKNKIRTQTTSGIWLSALPTDRGTKTWTQRRVILFTTFKSARSRRMKNRLASNLREPFVSRISIKTNRHPGMPICFGRGTKTRTLDTRFWSRCRACAVRPKHGGMSRLSGDFAWAYTPNDALLMLWIPGKKCQNLSRCKPRERRMIVRKS